MSTSAVETYNVTARALHWLTAALVLTLIPMGIAMGYAPPGPVQNALFDLHRSFGFVVLVVTVVRLAHRWKNPPPPEPADLAAWQRVVSHIVHWALYLILLANPILGWVGSSAFGAPVGIFWAFNLPALTSKNEALAGTLFTLHEWLGWAMTGLLAAHIGAALMHHFIQRDQILRRMLGPA